jgi:hypothetical protein
VELLEPDKNKNALSFCKEALNIEFTQIIGKMDTSCCISSIKRDEILAKMGKELLKKYIKYEKRKKFSIRINKWTKVLSQKEIDELLAPVERRRIPRILYKLKHIFDFKNHFWWEIVIWYKNRSYRIGIFKGKKVKAQASNNNEYKRVEVLSEEEIDELLTAINDKNNGVNHGKG